MFKIGQRFLDSSGNNRMDNSLITVSQAVQIQANSCSVIVECKSEW